MTRQEITKKAAEEIMALRDYNMLDSTMIELVIQSAMLDVENMAIERQLAVMDKALRQREDIHENAE